MTGSAKALVASKPKLRRWQTSKSEDQKFDSITVGDMKVRVFGETAIVTGSLDAKSTYKGKDTSGHLLWIDVFVKRQGRWQDVASQTTPITKQ
jgi:ketosteroid isomerase-like protein